MNAGESRELGHQGQRSVTAAAKAPSSEELSEFRADNTVASESVRAIANAVGLDEVEAPGVLLALREAGVFFDAARLAIFLARDAHHLKTGNGQPVLVLPGFMGADGSTSVIRNVLRLQGFNSHRWNLGRNLGPQDYILEGMQDRAKELADRYGQPISLVGWSLGGVFARELGRKLPAEIGQIVTLGSPFRMTLSDKTTVDPIRRIVESRFSDSVHELAIDEGSKPPLTVPNTAVYTHDGIVKFHLCINEEGPMRENVFVQTRHAGLGLHPAVMLVIADRLAQEKNSWSQFQTPEKFAHWFGEAIHWKPRHERGVIIPAVEDAGAAALHWVIDHATPASRSAEREPEPTAGGVIYRDREISRELDIAGR